MKEIEQRNKKELLLRCSCGGQHFLSFDWWEDEGKWNDKDEKTKKKLKKKLWKDYTIALIDDNKDSFCGRAKQCWNYLFTRKGEICHSGIDINSKDMKKIIKHFEEYMAL